MATPDWLGKTADWVEDVYTGARKFVAFTGPKSGAAISRGASALGASPGWAQDIGEAGVAVGTTAVEFVGLGKVTKPLQILGAAATAGKAGKAGTTVAKASTSTVTKSVVKRGKQEARTARVIDATHFDPHSTIKHLDRRGRVIFDGVEVRALRNLDHISTPDLKEMLKTGNNPRDLLQKLELHHHKQVPHRAPGAVVIEVPKGQHKITNKIQHPHGNKKGMGVGAEVRRDFNKFKRRFNKERAAQELRNRGEN